MREKECNKEYKSMKHCGLNGRSIIALCLVFTFTFSLTSCHSSRSFMYKGTDMRELVRAGNALGFDIERKDNWPLMIEAASWIGTPYRYGGNARSGIDCSGLNSEIYRTVFYKQLQRRSIDQYHKDCKHVKKSHLRQGDLVFFAIHDNVKAKNINHTGIYLKDGLFIHASTSRGVVVDNLKTKYFDKYWIGGGRVK